MAGRSDRPFSVGFAAETENLLEYASRKLKDKDRSYLLKKIRSLGQWEQEMLRQEQRRGVCYG